VSHQRRLEFEWLCWEVIENRFSVDATRIISAKHSNRWAMRRINSNKSSFSRHEDSRCEKQPMSEGEQNLQHYLTKLGLPSGLHGAVRSVYDSMESRIWILDNSYDMNIKDCSLIKAHDKLETIGREGGVSRWDEQLQCVDFHLKVRLLMIDIAKLFFRASGA